MSDTQQKHFCIVGYKLAITDKLNNKSQFWPIAKRITEQGHKISIISFKGSPGKPVLKEGSISAYYLGEQDLFVAKEDFSDLALNKILKLHQEDPIHHIHSIDVSLNVKKRELKKSKITLSYGVQVLNLEKYFSVKSLSKATTLSVAKSTFWLPLKFAFKFLTTEWKVLNGASGVFVSSPKQALTLERYYLFPPKWIFQVPLNADISPLLQRTKSREILDELSFTENTPVIATASSMNTDSDLNFLLNVFEKVSLKYPKAKFLILGNGPSFKDIEREVLMKALDSKVVFIRNFPSSKIPDYISIADIFINVKYETSGLGKTLVEAMAQKKVIIGSEFSAIAEIIRDEENGFLIRPGEEAKAINLIHQVFNNQIDKESIGENARHDILKALNPDNLTEKTLYAFNKIIKRTI